MVWMERERERGVGLLFFNIPATLVPFPFLSSLLPFQTILKNYLADVGIHIWKIVYLNFMSTFQSPELHVTNYGSLI